MSMFVPEVQAQARVASPLLARRVREYFTDEEHRKEFEDWYRQRTGKEYTWRKVTE